MYRGFARTALRLTILTAALVSGLAAAAGLDGRELVKALRAGGYNIYFRHAQTDWSRGDDIRDESDIPSCDGSRVRQLSDEGRMTAAAIGSAIRELRIPVVRILASPYCRTMETARQMELGEVESTEDLMNLRSASFVGGRDAVIARARKLLASRPPAAGNAIYVAHGNVARHATPVYPGEAEGVVFHPDGRGGFDLVARITPPEWARLADGFAR
ncbi:MAG: hypothetical protein DWQ08_05845 [Proteobacteria bacterium]|nr:MAG: hypothetical protein DWQ08_05845 [Pseudomonadota bacterium]